MLARDGRVLRSNPGAVFTGAEVISVPPEVGGSQDNERTAFLPNMARRPEAGPPGAIWGSGGRAQDHSTGRGSQDGVDPDNQHAPTAGPEQRAPGSFKFEN